LKKPSVADVAVTGHAQFSETDGIRVMPMPTIRQLLQPCLEQFYSADHSLLAHPVGRALIARLFKTGPTRLARVSEHRDTLMRLPWRPNHR